MVADVLTEFFEGRTLFAGAISCFGGCLFLLMPYARYSTTDWPFCIQVLRGHITVPLMLILAGYAQNYVLQKSSTTSSSPRVKVEFGCRSYLPNGGVLRDIDRIIRKKTGGGCSSDAEEEKKKTKVSQPRSFSQSRGKTEVRAPPMPPEIDLAIKNKASTAKGRWSTERNKKVRKGHTHTLTQPAEHLTGYTSEKLRLLGGSPHMGHASHSLIYPLGYFFHSACQEDPHEYLISQTSLN